MSFETLKKAILTEASQQVAAVEDRFAEQIAQKEGRIKERAKSQEEEIIRQAESEGETESRRLHQEHQLAAKANVLEAKQEELNTTRDEAIKQLLAQDAAATKELLESLLKFAPADATLIPGSEHADALKQVAKQATVAEETVANDGGFIARSAKEEVNLTIRHLVQQLFIRHRADIAQKLFT